MNAATLTTKATRAFSLAKAIECAQASALAYAPAGPDVLIVETPLAHARIAVHADYAVLAFRGTANIKDFMTDCEAIRTKVLDYELHLGFKNAFFGDERRPPVEGIWLKLLAATPANKPLLITGHSYGGALAVLAAMSLSRMGWPILGVYTFGQPRVGNAAFARAYDADLGDDTWRFVTDLDIVPRLPGALAGYRHAGHEMFLTTVPWGRGDAMRGDIVDDPPLPYQILCDAWAIWRDYRSKHISALNDHHIVQYQKRLASLQESQALQTTLHTA